MVEKMGTPVTDVGLLRMDEQGRLIVVVEGGQVEAMVERIAKIASLAQTADPATVTALNIGPKLQELMGDVRLMRTAFNTLLANLTSAGHMSKD